MPGSWDMCRPRSLTSAGSSCQQTWIWSPLAGTGIGSDVFELKLCVTSQARTTWLGGVVSGPTNVAAAA